MFEYIGTILMIVFILYIFFPSTKKEEFSNGEFVFGDTKSTLLPPTPDMDWK